MRLLVGVLAIAATSSMLAAMPPAADVLAWSTLPPLPDHIGLGGPIAGAHDGHLVIAGGANFPDSPLWETDKVWHDDIWILPSGGAWRNAAATLPTPTAYAVTLTHPERGIIVIGGSDGQSHLADAYIIEIDRGQPVITELPPLPTPLAYAAGGLIGDSVFVAGGQVTPDAQEASKRLWTLDLAAEPPRWRAGPDLPGPARILSVAGVSKGRFHVLGGAALEPGPDNSTRRRPLTDAWAFAQKENSWQRLADLPRPVTGAPTPAIQVGHDHLVIVGGDTGEFATRTDTLRDAHPGFADDILAYNVITDAWTMRGTFPRTGDAPAWPREAVWPTVTTTVVPWQDRYLIPSGEMRPRVRSPLIHAVTPVLATGTLASMDWAVIALYLLALLAMGVYFSRREKSTDDFFLAGRRIPWWAAGISIFATQLSAITFMAIPAKAYETDWVYFIQNLGIFVVAPFVAWIFLPFYRRLGLTTAYEYLERRFGVSVRLLGSAQFILAQVGRVAVVVFLPALALSAVTGIDVALCIALMGILAIVYTVLGGIEVVIWSDVLQTIVLLGGAVIAGWIMIGGIPGGFTGFMSEASSGSKFHMVNTEFDLTEAVLIVVILGALFNNIIPYVSDQAVVQRYLTTPDERSARIAIWTGGILAIPASILFFGLGTLLWVYYRSNPELLGPTGAVDQILPWFIMHELPVGVSGLVIAAIFAAAMSSIDSSMNSVSTAFTTDFYRRFRPDVDDHAALSVARWGTVVFGIVGTGAALLIATLEIRSVLDLWFMVLGLFASGLCGLFFLGVVSGRPGTAAAISGLAVSAVVNFVVGTYTDISVLLIATFGIFSCLLTGLLVGVFLPSTRSLEGLTLASRPPDPGPDVKFNG